VIGALNSAPERAWLQLRPVPLQVRRYPQFVPWLLQRRAYHGGIAPLRTHPFNAAKSDVKVLDYAALGLGCLCSRGPAYDPLIARGLALGTANDSWQAALAALLADPRPLQQCGRRAAQHLWRHRSCARVASQLWNVLQRDR
jgi:glycosyltransferase involved in cell wall biosynthesis